MVWGVKANKRGVRIDIYSLKLETPVLSDTDTSLFCLGWRLMNVWVKVKIIFHCICKKGIADAHHLGESL